MSQCGSRANRSMPKLLVVDDSATMRKIIMRIVNRAGLGSFEFVEARDGRAALEALSKEEGIDVILCDIRMPRMDGVTFVRCVRDQQATEVLRIDGKVLVKRVSNSIPIVMITSEGSLEKVQEALAAGANDYVKKPFTPDQLKAKLAPFVS